MARFVREKGKNILQTVGALVNGVTGWELRSWGSPPFPDTWWHFLDEGLMAAQVICMEMSCSVRPAEVPLHRLLPEKGTHWFILSPMQENF